MGRLPFVVNRFALHKDPSPAVLDLSVNCKNPVGAENSANTEEMEREASVEMTVVLGQCRLSPSAGTFVELDNALGGEVDICVDGKTVARGRLAESNGQIGVEIVRILENGES